MRYVLILQIVLASLLLVDCKEKSSDSNGASPNPAPSSDVWAGLPPQAKPLTPSVSSAAADEANIADPGVTGPYSFAVSSVSPSGSAATAGFNAMEIYYPIKGPSNGPFAALTLEPGWSDTLQTVTWLASHLASHGFVVACVTQEQILSPDVSLWGRSHTAALNALLAKSADPSDVLYKKVDASRLGIVGYSMGGAGAAMAASSQAPYPLAAVALISPFFGTVSAPVCKINVPVMLFAGASDDVAKVDQVLSCYSMISGVDKGYYVINNLGHGVATHPDGPAARYLTKYLTSWLKVYLAKNNAYNTYLKGKKVDADHAAGVVGDAAFQPGSP